MKWEDKKKEINSISEEEKAYIELLADIVTTRLDKGITQRQLEKMTGLKQSAIARFENPSETSNVLTMLKILHALDCELVIKPKSN